MFAGINIRGEDRKEAAGTRDAGGMQPVQGTVLTRKPAVQAS